MTATRRNGAGLALADIEIMQRERGLVLGGVDTGKSTLCDQLGTAFDARYAAKQGRRLILDSKPRYRAQWLVNGRSAAKRYKGWSHGQAVPGSVVVDDPADLDLAWKTGARVVIVQRIGERDDPIPRLVNAAERFLASSKANRPQLAQLDETLDFFHGNGAPRGGGGDAIVQLARAGRERGTAVLYASQRTRGIPATLMAELSKAYVLRVDSKPDLKRLAEMGMPDFEPVDVPHAFHYWTKQDYRTVYGPMRLEI